jgi:hypothetical protein
LDKPRGLAQTATHIVPARRPAMAKGQMRKTKETRKPKKEKPKATAAQPQRKPGEVQGLENLRNK